MIRLAVAQLRNQIARALVLLLGIMVAATGFSVLTGTAQTQRLEIVGSVRENYRAQYDILVRPKGSATAIERETGMVRANYLSGIHGGITLGQLERIKKIDGIEVAAPIGMIGYFTGTGNVQVPVTDVLDPGERTMLRVERTRVADRGLTKIPRSPHYQYITRRPLTYAMEEGERLDSTTEKLGRGREVKLGTALTWPADRKDDPFDQGPTADAWSTRNGMGEEWGGAKKGQAVVGFAQDFPLLLAAIDPKAEAELAGLDKAVVEGAYLGTGKKLTKWDVPLLATSKPMLDQREELVISRLPAKAAKMVAAGKPAAKVRAYLDTQKGSVVQRSSLRSEEFYEDLLDTWKNQGEQGDQMAFAPLTRYWTAGPVTYRRDALGVLAPQPVTNDAKIWNGPDWANGAPIGSADTQFRKLTLRPLATGMNGEGGLGGPLLFKLMGRFDATKLPGFSELSQVPMETYNTPAVVGADTESRNLLGGQDLLPTDNVAGYLQAPPLLLTDLGGLAKIAKRDRKGPLAKAPLSVIRVRAALVTGPDPVNGFTFLAQKRQVPDLTDIPVVVVSATARGPIDGVEYVLAKPVDANQLLLAVKQLAA